MADPAAAILIVDDDEMNRYTLARRLRREGYQDLTEAADGLTALALLRSHPFDLVLLDVMMPGMNGYEVLRTLEGGPGAARHPGDHDLGAAMRSTAPCAASSWAPRTTCPSRSTPPCCGPASARRWTRSGCATRRRPISTRSGGSRSAASGCCTPSCRPARSASSRRPTGSRRGVTRTWRCCSATSSTSPPIATAIRRSRWSPSCRAWWRRSRTSSPAMGWRRSRPSATP